MLSRERLAGNADAIYHDAIYSNIDYADNDVDLCIGIMSLCCKWVGFCKLKKTC